MTDLQRLIEADLHRWERKFDDLVRRGRKGERNLELAGATCVGATSALRAILRAVEAGR